MTAPVDDSHAPLGNPRFDLDRADDARVPFPGEPAEELVIIDRLPASGGSTGELVGVGFLAWHDRSPRFRRPRLLHFDWRAHFDR